MVLNTPDLGISSVQLFIHTSTSTVVYDSDCELYFFYIPFLYYHFIELQGEKHNVSIFYKSQCLFIFYHIFELEQPSSFCQCCLWAHQVSSLLSKGYFWYHLFMPVVNKKTYCTEVMSSNFDPTLKILYLDLIISKKKTWRRPWKQMDPFMLEAAVSLIGVSG